MSELHGTNFSCWKNIRRLLYLFHSEKHLYPFKWFFFIVDLEVSTLLVPGDKCSGLEMFYDIPIEIGVSIILSYSPHSFSHSDNISFDDWLTNFIDSGKLPIG